MKTIFVIFIGLLFSQASVLSFNGFGENQNYQNPANAGAGQMRLFSTSYNSGASTALATIYRDSFTKLKISSQIQNLNSNNAVNLITQGLDLLSVSFPIDNDKAFQISLSPQYWSQYSINENKNIETVEFDGENYAFKSNYYGRGGYSDLGLVWSQKINEHFSYGLGMSSYFGNRFQSDSTFTYNIFLNSDEEEVITPKSISILNTTNHYQGYGLKMDLLTYYQKFEIGFSIETIGPFKIEQKKYYSVGLSQTNINKIKIPNLSNRILFGIKYNFTDQFACMIENDIQKWSIIDDSYMILNSQNYNLNRFSLGSYYHHINKSIGFYQSITFRGGLFINSWENQVTKQKITDFGLTLGTGINYNNNSNSISFSLVFGERKFDIYGITKEQYFDFILGFEVGEKWFIRKK